MSLVLLSLPVAVDVVSKFQEKVREEGREEGEEGREGTHISHPSLPPSLPPLLQSMQKMAETVAKFHSLYGALTILGVYFSPQLAAGLGRK